MEREDREEIGERMVTTLLLNREVMMTTTIFLSLFGIALMIKLIGEMI